MAKTKIIATIGPACDTFEMLKAMIEAGVNVFRFNLKHNVMEWHEERIKLVNKVAKEMGKAVGILLDLQGCEIRIGTFDEGHLEVEEGELVTFAPTRNPGEKTIILKDETVMKALKVGTIVLIDDGLTKFTVLKRKGDKIITQVLKGGKIGNNKGMNVPSLEIDLPTLVEKDLQHISLASRHQVDYIALSFVRHKQDVQILRTAMKKRGVDAKILAKIENQFAIDRFDEILKEADGIVVARGDLGVEVELYKLPVLQKIMIKKARAAGKPIITATQMMHSMLHNPLPTRAEVSDVANAVLDSCDTIWFSEETAMGKYPLEVVKMATQIAEYTEKNRDGLEPTLVNQDTHEDAIATSAFHLYQGYELTHPGMIKAFVVLTEYGLTARMLAKFRATVPILAMTDYEETRDKLTLSYGVEPYYLSGIREGGRKALEPVFNYLVKQGVLKEGDQVIAVRGRQWTDEDQTNTISLETVG